MYIEKVEGALQYIQKQFFLSTLRDMLDIMNGYGIIGLTHGEVGFSDKVDKKVSFTKLYYFFKSHKQYSACLKYAETPVSLQ